MKKSKLAIGLMTAMLTAGTLAGCDNVVKYSAGGKIISYKEGSNEIQVITADDLLKDYYDDSSKYQSIFDAINSIVIRNYFNNTEIVKVNGVDIELGKKQMDQIRVDAKRKVESDKRTAQTNAKNNNTSYDDEFNNILSSKGATNEQELTDKYIEELQKETFDTNFYKYHINDVKLGDADIKYTDSEGKQQQVWNGYFKDMIPYHVSHILVKIGDSGSTNYANGTITEDDAKNLYNVVNEIAKGKTAFGTIAYNNAAIGDTGSAKNYGDLGIMDYSTGYVNEFKLGIYAYENFFNTDEAKINLVKNSKINIPEETGLTLQTDLKKAVKDAYGTEIPTVEFSAFEELNELAKQTKDSNDKSVLDDSANFFPRNIVYNRYFNRHSFAFITNKDATPIEETSTDFSGYVKHNYGGQDYNVLSVKTAGGFKPVLMARAGSDYQGIHFIVVDRSPFEGTGTDFTDMKVNDVSLNDYYTTYYPEQSDYPTKDGKPLKTYINFTSSDVADTKPRAESLVSTLKSYDSDRLNKYIFQRFFEMEKLHISDEELDKALKTWISRGFEKKQIETEEAWEKTWKDYIDTLGKQNSARKKLVSEACKIGYLYANDNGKKQYGEEKTIAQITREGQSKTLYEEMKAFLEAEGHGDKVDEYLGVGGSKKVSELFKTEGGLCNDGKTHI